MSEVTERIAAEHDATVRVQETRSGWRQPVQVSTVYDCKCGPVGLGLTGISQHIADVAERAVREQIVRDIERLTPNVYKSGAFCAGMDRAARIAKGENR